MTIPNRYEVIYPGHPLVIATLILNKYRENLAEAFEKSQWGWPNALSDNDIPGAGDAVHSGLDVLYYIRHEIRTPEEAVQESLKFWSDLRGQSSAYRDKVDSGNAQALQCAPDFLKLVSEYIHLVPVLGRYKK